MIEEPFSPECRLAICRYRLGRGDYLSTIAEMTDLASPTICSIKIQVLEAIVQCFGALVHLAASVQ